MDTNVINLSGADLGKIDLSDFIFALEPREDILQRMVRYQLSKRQQGSHNALGRSDVSRTGKKMYKQKGTGGARHHAASAPQFRGGGKAHGPVVRSHAHSLPKKVRSLALRHAISAKTKSNHLIVVDDFVCSDAKTSSLAGLLKKLDLTNALMVSGKEIDLNFSYAASNIPNIDVLPIDGINVYDILRRKKLVLSKAAIEALEERFK
jgi:large subunit ribosomal protein L4